MFSPLSGWWRKIFSGSTQKNLQTRLGNELDSCDPTRMSLAELKNESAALRPDEQRELAAFLAVIRMQQSGEWDAATSVRDAPERQGWVSLDEAKRQLEAKP